MTSDKDPLVSGDAALEAGTQSFFTAIGEGAKLVVPAVAASAGWQAMLAVTLPLMGLAVAKGAHRLFAPRTVLLAKGYAKAFDDDPGKVADHAKEHAYDPDYHDTMFRTFRTMIDAAETEVVETLGFLAGQYTMANKRPDAFFRALGRILSDFEAGELALFTHLLRMIDEARDLDQEWVDVVSEPDQDENGPEPAVGESVDLVDAIGIATGTNAKTCAGNFPGSTATRFFVALKREGLAKNKSTIELGEPIDRSWPNGDDAMLISVPILHRIRGIIEPLHAATSR